MCLSVVTVNWNSGPHACRAVDSPEPVHEDIQEMVVHNNTSDESLENFRRDPAIVLLRQTQNRRFAGAANLAIDRATAPLDEPFHRAWSEDVDFCKQLQAWGWKAPCYPDCPAGQAGRISLGVLRRRSFTKISYRNLLKYSRKPPPEVYRLLWLPVRPGTWARLLRSRR